MESQMWSIQEIIKQSIETKQFLLADSPTIKSIHDIVEVIVSAFKNDKKLLLCGNGGSASDAQHIAAELSGRFYIDRAPLFAEALHVNSSYLTAVANDYSYDEVYARLVKAMGRKGDVLIGISTSGNSKNILKAIEEANTIGMTTIGFTGKSGGKLKELCNECICIPSIATPRIQESHILVGHIICELVEKKMFGKD
jgi:D-sedoheptulose 7-phosphate isomerase